MKTRCLMIALVGCLVACLAACDARADIVRKTTGTTIGTVDSTSSLKVVVTEQSTLQTEIPVNEIVKIDFDGEPTSMKTARAELLRGNYEGAVEALDKVQPNQLTRDVIRQDFEFYKALCAAKLALGGTGEIKEAGGQMIAFAKANPNSYHYLEACEVVGDLLVAVGAYAPAVDYYGRLAKAPWADYKMRAGVAIGRAQLAQNQMAEAARSFDAVIAINAQGDLANAQRLAATLGKARCLAAAEQHEEAIKMVESILARSDPEDVDLHARAYNTLGTALRKAGRDRDALLAFLHVDVLYFALPEAHAEALANLAELWDSMHKTERAVRARAILEEQYRNSPWAKKAG
ncbi:MAG TPA: tetratricopeptide repeat protein [Thermoguttaceae bacterium]|nr:tetratricopeptide repeat protein [Thermoguttaceae bacterium]